MKSRRQYQEGLMHFAVAGIAGSGKSSLVNAFCGVRNKDRGAAPTGVVETTATVTRYPDPHPKNPFVWYDIPGAGTCTVPDEEYFTEQGLYIFDAIVVLFDNRFTATDLAILRSCAHFDVPTYIVRSKSKYHIDDITDEGLEQDEDADEADVREAARQQYIEQTRESVAGNLEMAGLEQQRVYMVESAILRQVVQGKHPKEYIDEWDLLRDILEEACSRRIIGVDSEGQGGDVVAH
ncbi:hypothetical protein FOMPIDRAFT_45938 [Fomitopsis schrenkii]|uniref:IRG-type G domain-containing protein n=1 Tax=Fomitopsis schrenkii TaxID=2126942 RepID=S8DKM8_FOMSC|nr:hypothetical protein FOMPIDRAFT_45938 [Fomitopsis schrenkii]